MQYTASMQGRQLKVHSLLQKLSEGLQNLGKLEDSNCSQYCIPRNLRLLAAARHAMQQTRIVHRQHL